MSFNYRRNYVDANKNNIRTSYGVPRVGPAGLPRYGGVPLKAAAGQATATKLQTY